MDYDAIAAMFLVPNGGEGPGPPVPRSAARRLRDAVEPIATIGWWSRPAADAFTALGHGFFDGYVWGRASALGPDVATSVVVSAFGVFHPALLGTVYEHARTLSSASDILVARADGASAGLRQATFGFDATAAATVADHLLSAVMTLEPGPRPLFAGLQALPLPSDPYGRLWRAAELVREHRGDGHLAACAVAGLDMAEMNVLTELWLGYNVGEYSATRGFDAALLASAVESLALRGWVVDGVISVEGRRARDAIEQATDDSQVQLIRALGNDLDVIVDRLGAVSAAVVSSQAAPADPRKRAAG